VTPYKFDSAYRQGKNTFPFQLKTMDAFTPVDVTPSYTAGVLQGGNSLPIGFMRVGSFTEDNYLNMCADEWKNVG